MGLYQGELHYRPNQRATGGINWRRINYMFLERFSIIIAFSIWIIAFRVGKLNFKIQHLI